MDLDKEGVLALLPSASSKRIINPNMDSALSLHTELDELGRGSLRHPLMKAARTNRGDGTSSTGNKTIGENLYDRLDAAAVPRENSIRLKIKLKKKTNSPTCQTC